jgi:hypothetical protein
MRIRFDLSPSQRRKRNKQRVKTRGDVTSYKPSTTRKRRGAAATGMKRRVVTGPKRRLNRRYGLRLPAHVAPKSVSKLLFQARTGRI